MTNRSRPTKRQHARPWCVPTDLRFRKNGQAPLHPLAFLHAAMVRSCGRFVSRMVQLERLRHRGRMPSLVARLADQDPGLRCHLHSPYIEAHRQVGQRSLTGVVPLNEQVTRTPASDSQRILGGMSLQERNQARENGNEEDSVNRWKYPGSAQVIGVTGPPPSSQTLKAASHIAILPSRMVHDSAPRPRILLPVSASSQVPSQ